MAEIFQHWYFHAPNFVLAALMWLLAGRIVMSAILRPDSTNQVWRAVCRLSDPVIALVSWITPRAVPHTLVMAFSFIWLLVLRFLLLAGLANLGIAPPPAA